MHSTYIPLMRCTKSLGELGYFDHKIVSEVSISWCMKSIKHFRYNDLDVLFVCHFEEKIKSLFFQGFILALEAFDYHELIIIKKFWVIFYQHTQSLDTKIFHIVRTFCFKIFSKEISCFILKSFIRIDVWYCLDTLISDSNRNVVVSLLRLPKNMFKNCITVFRWFLITFSKNLQNLENFYLDPRSWHSVIIKLFW